MKAFFLSHFAHLLFCRKRFAALIFALAAGAAQAGTLDLGSPTTHTPYDPYLGPVWDVMHRLGGNKPDPAVVEQLVREGRAFRYSFNKDQPYVPQLPDVTEATKSGDCKAKALWLASKMDCRNVRFVIGKASAARPVNHAWLIWEGPQGWLILDATMLSRPLEPEKCAASDYIPNFSFAPSGGKYAHIVAAAAPTKKYGDHL
jgi:hypothetical protein